MEIYTCRVDVHYSEKPPLVCCNREYRLDSLQWWLPAYWSGLSPRLNSRATVRDLTCIGSSSKALCVSICQLQSVRQLFSCTPRSLKDFTSSARARRTADHGSSLPVTSSVNSTFQCFCFFLVCSVNQSIIAMLHPSPRSQLLKVLRLLFVALDFMCTAYAVRDDLHCHSWCRSVPSYLHWICFNVHVFEMPRTYEILHTLKIATP